MSDASANNLNGDAIPALAGTGIQREGSSLIRSRTTLWRQLLAAIGSQAEGKPSDVAQEEIADYDWRHPHCFSSSQLNRLNNFAKKIAEIMSGKFTQLYHRDFNVTVTSISQHFAGGFLDQVLRGGQKNYNLAFVPGSAGGGFGSIIIPEKTAIAWVKELLGEAEPAKDTDNSGSQQPDKPLSQLEESLLYDIASAIVDSLAISLRSTEGGSVDYDVRPAEAFVKDRLPIELQDIEEICVIVFGIEKVVAEGSQKGPAHPAGGSEVSFLIPCRRLTHHWPVVGKVVEPDKKLSNEDISKSILEHLQRMPITVTVQLGTAMLSFEQIMGLSTCDIFLLDKAYDEPVELVVEGRVVLRGRPAKLSGQHAIVITDLEDYAG